MVFAFGMTTSDDIVNNCSSPSSSTTSIASAKDETTVKMIAVTNRHQETNAAELNLVSERQLMDMSSAVAATRSPPMAAVQDELLINSRKFNSVEPQTITNNHSDQWQTSVNITNAGAAIHRKSFNIDALLAKSQSGERDKERFVNSPDSANDCYNEDRRDFTPSPEGHRFRWVKILLIPEITVGDDCVLCVKIKQVQKFN